MHWIKFFAYANNKPVFRHGYQLDEGKTKEVPFELIRILSERFCAILDEGRRV